MAPTEPAALTYSMERLILSNKLRKPMVEKMRRDRINSSIEQLKSLPGTEFSRLQHQPVDRSSCSSPVSQGYSWCVQEMKHFLSWEEVMSQSQKSAEPFLEPAIFLRKEQKSECVASPDLSQPDPPPAKRKLQLTAPSGGCSKVLQTVTGDSN